MYNIIKTHTLYKHMSVIGTAFYVPISYALIYGTPYTHDAMTIYSVIAV